MRNLRFFQRIFFSIVLLQSTISFAFETDQYNLPPQPLADIGDEVTDYVKLNIQKSIDKLNKEILLHQNCLDSSPKSIAKCDSPTAEKEKLADLRSSQAIAKEIYKTLGSGIPPFTSSETWLESHRFKEENVRYKTSFRDSIYFSFPTDYLGISPTVNLYGTEFGTDKIAHFFQQGYTYYKVYNRAVDNDSTDAEALQKAIAWGQKSEHTFYGTLISGVYSNADLFANYAGLKFYLGLTQTIKTGNFSRPPILVIKNGLWAWNDEQKLSETLLKPFISVRLNEALNPSIVTNFLGMRNRVRRVVKNQSCAEWQKDFPNLSITDLDKISQEIQSWNGENYGFTDSKNFITIAGTCYDSQNSVRPIVDLSSFTQDFLTLDNLP